MNRKHVLFLTVAIAAVATPAVADGTRPVLALPVNPSPEDFLRARVFEEPLVPVGGTPDTVENAALANALIVYSKRMSPDDFSSLTRFLEKHPQSVWNAALLTGLGLEYYNTAYYSRALEAWTRAWSLGQKATNAAGKFLADRAVCELAGLYSRLGRMNELEALLESVEQRLFLGGATERVNLAREALSMMKYQPGIAFRCGPLALQRILLSDQKLLGSSPANAMMEIFNSASTQQGFSLPQVAELSEKVGLNYQMAFRETRGAFVVPSVVHWKVGHYAAIVRQVGDRFLLEDPTFVNTVWASREALEAETSGYFLIPPGDLPPGWRKVDKQEAASVWGKGVTSGIDPDNYTEEDLEAGSCPFERGAEPGMAISRVHLGLANLQIRDTPVAYRPPVGPPVRFTVRYNHRDYIQKPSAVSRILGPKWTHDWNAWIGDTPMNPLADVRYYVGGGGARTFTGFNTNTQAFAPQQFDQTRLKRTGPDSYEMTSPDGSKRIFGLRPGGGAEVLLTQVVDPAGNAVTLNYDETERLISVTDAIGQVTTISYENPTNSTIITKVTDPFGRFATFDYTYVGFRFTNCCPTNVIIIDVPVLSKITDVLGLESRFQIVPISGFISQMITPYGTTSFSAGEGGGPNQTTRFVESLYPDGSRDRVEFNQNTNNLVASSDPPGQVPQGISAFNQYLYARNTFYWDRNACAKGYKDYSKARIYHWLHTPNIAVTAGILESTKEPLEGRVWYNYAGQPGPHAVGNTDRPSRVGRVLDDGTAQLYSYAYNAFGHVTETTDPIGRKLRFLYATNGIDLLEARQVRGVNNDLLFAATYNNQHRPLTSVDAAGQTNTYTYNARGQILTETNPKNETTTYTYDPDGYLTAVDGPLPETNDLIAATHDAFGRLQTITGVSGYTLFFDYDAMDRLVRITHPDSTFTKFTYDRLDLINIRDRDGRHTLLEYDSVGQVKKKTDTLGRETLFSWCRCGAIKSVIDPLGRATDWHSDVQGRLISKQYSDGSKISYAYENTTSRLRQVIDEKQQVMQFAYNRDNTLQSIAYANAVVPHPGVSYAYDPDYERVISMTDGTGSTVYSYHPITNTPTLGAGQLASVDGPLPDDTITYDYDELGRRVSTAINGVGSTMAFDAAGRVGGETNALGSFTYAYEGGSGRPLSQTLPNGQVEERSYGGDLLDRTLQRITHRLGATPISEFIYGRDIAAGRITSWSQRIGAQPPSIHTFDYDAADQLLSVTVTNAGALVNAFAYSYDPAGNRLTELVGGTNHTASYNALNQISTSTAPGVSRTNEWDAQDRLVAVNSGNQRTEFTYDNISRLVSLRRLTNGVEVSFRRLVWRGRDICEERDASGVVTKRFFDQGMKVETGPAAGSYFYTRDHLGSIREVTDAGGNVRARYAYDPYGRRTRLTGDMEADFGFAGMFWAVEANLSLTLYRAYDPDLGRWLSRDPLEDAEMKEGPNLYAYVVNDPVNLIDPDGLISCLFPANAIACAAAGITAVTTVAQRAGPVIQRAGQAAGAIVDRMGTCLSRTPTLTGMGQIGPVNPLAATAPQLVQEVAVDIPRLAQIAQSSQFLVARSRAMWDWMIRQKRLWPDNIDLLELAEANRRLIEEAQRRFGVRF